ncbi:hypothetical protein LOD99_7838 [Oopsacas minuta]|uniref:Uncharacterized protein n=1 Tax=Oopsacas minuta TaxID=111878 RepID=A0AAV7JPL5_9METZ|nr:hypothetical protein LOD99_7838 [Oopsacas minuta]
MKNLRNNWITDKLQELSSVDDGIEYLACWKDIHALYEEDKKSPLQLTKLTYTSVFPKPLQRQSVPLVCQVFHEKTVVALKALKIRSSGKDLGQARQRHGGNFYIDVDVISAYKAQRLHQMLKLNIIPQGCLDWKCSYCTVPIVLEDIDVMLETSTKDTQTRLDSTDTLKHK